MDVYTRCSALFIFTTAVWLRLLFIAVQRKLREEKIQGEFPIHTPTPLHRYCFLVSQTSFSTTTTSISSRLIMTPPSPTHLPSLATLKELDLNLPPPTGHPAFDEPAVPFSSSPPLVPRTVCSNSHSRRERERYYRRFPPDLEAMEESSSSSARRDANEEGEKKMEKDMDWSGRGKECDDGKTAEPHVLERMRGLLGFGAGKGKG